MLWTDTHKGKTVYPPHLQSWGIMQLDFISNLHQQNSIFWTKMDQIRNLYHTTDFIISVAWGQEFSSTWTGDLAPPFHPHLHLSLPGIS